MKREILFITAEYSEESSGGAGVYAYELTRALIDQGLSIHILCPGHTKKVTKVSDLLTIEYVPTIFKPLLRTPSFWLNTRLAVKRITKEKQISIIHSNTNAAALVSSSIPLVTTIQHPALLDDQNYLFFQRLVNKLDIYFEKRMVAKSKIIITTSEPTKQLVEKIYPKYKDKVSLIHIGIDTQFYTHRASGRDIITKRHTIDRKKIIIFYPGGARGRRKGLEYFLPALRQIDSEKVQCIISGVSRELGWTEYFQKLVKENNMQDKITFCGEIAYKDLPLYYSAAAITVFPSLFEGFGLPTIESLACGTPVIASDTGEAKNILDGGNNGILIPPKNSKAITNALAKLLIDTQLRKTFASHARASVVTKYSWTTLSKEYIKLYDKISI